MTTITFTNGYVLHVDPDGDMFLSHEDTPELERQPLAGFDQETFSREIENLPHPHTAEAEAQRPVRSAGRAYSTPRDLARAMRAGMRPGPGTPVWVRRGAERLVTRGRV